VRVGSGVEVGSIAEQNKTVEAQAVAEENEAEACSARIVDAQRRMAALSGDVQHAAQIRRSPWKGTEAATLRDLARQESGVKARLRRAERELVEAKAVRDRHFKELDKERFMKKMVEQRLAESVAKPDPLKPSAARDAKKDLGYLVERCRVLEIEHEGMQTRVAEAEVQLSRIRKVLDGFSFAREKIRIRVLLGQYVKLARELGPVLREYYDIVSKVDRSSQDEAELRELVKWPGRSVTQMVIGLPKPFFTDETIPGGEEFAHTVDDNFFYRG
jgi:hypothetical protein